MSPWIASAVRFSVVFVSIVGVLSGVVLLDRVVFEGAAAWILSSTTASNAAVILQLFSTDVIAVGNEIRYRTFTCRVIPECTGIDMIGLFVAAVAAFPSGWKHKLVGLALGVPALIALNLIRIVLLVQTGARWPEALEYAHLYIAPLIVLTVTLGLWLLWADRATDGART